MSPEHERAQYFQERGWNWTFANPAPVAPKPAKRNLYSDKEHQLMRPTLKVFHS